MKRLLLRDFLLYNSLASLSGWERTAANKNYSSRISYAIRKGDLTLEPNDEIEVVSFCRWAIKTTKTKRSKELCWPFLKECVLLPPEPKVAVGSVLIQIENNIVPTDLETAQKMLVEAWRDIAKLRKENNEFKAKEIASSNRRKKQSKEGTKAANKRWGKKGT